LERVEGLLRIHESFWGRMEAALSVLQQRATIIEGLIAVIVKNPQLVERFMQKLEEYFSLWQSAALLCQQFLQFSPNHHMQQVGNANVTGSNVPGLDNGGLLSGQQHSSSSTVVVTNETSPNSSLESYDGDI